MLLLTSFFWCTNGYFAFKYFHFFVCYFFFIDTVFDRLDYKHTNSVFKLVCYYQFFLKSFLLIIFFITLSILTVHVSQLVKSWAPSTQIVVILLLIVRTFEKKRRSTLYTMKTKVCAMFQEKIVIQKNEIKNWKTDSVQQVDFTTESVSDGCESNMHCGNLRKTSQEKRRN